MKQSQLLRSNVCVLHSCTLHLPIVYKDNSYQQFFSELKKRWWNNPPGWPWRAGLVALSLTNVGSLMYFFKCCARYSGYVAESAITCLLLGREEKIQLQENWFWFNDCKSVSRSCAVVKSEQFWRATGQSNLADGMEDCSTGQSAYEYFGSFCCGQPFVYQVWLSSGSPEFVSFSYCTWLSCRKFE